jgi:hypothetical protein
MYTASEYAEMLIIYGECRRNAREDTREYAIRVRFPRRLVYRARDTGSLVPTWCPILESMELILIGKIGKFSHEKCKSVFWTYVRRIVPLVIRRIISPSVYHGKIIFSREIRLSNVTLLLIHNCV